ncbi:MAG: hypothetical protein ACFE7R_03550 [Candidatus Hodarchaeota archaeon]
MELGFAWHHSKLPKHARTDFEDMLVYNCNSVLIALSENDMDYWYPNIIEIVEVAKDVGLKVWLNFWAFGGIFGGEPPSAFLHKNHKHRQIAAESKEVMPAACINQPEFRNWFFDSVHKIVRESKIDGVFLDEPHYFWTFSTDDFTCICEECQQKFEDEIGSPMPMEYNEDIRRFREENMHRFLIDSCKTIKGAKSSAEVCVCVIPADFEFLGTPDWDRIAAIPEVDMFSTDPYYHVFGLEREWAIEAAQKTVETAKRHRKKSQLWVQMFRQEAGEEQAVASLVPEYADLGVDSIFGWSYLANKGTTISSDNPDLLWELVTTEYRRMG